MTQQTSYKISLITPVYNAFRYLDETFESVKVQTIGFENIEWLLVDDHSSDGSFEKISLWAEEYPNLKGVWLEDSYQRQYPYNSLACDVIGFVQGDNEGAYGLEEFYNDTLNGTNGREYGYLNEEETLERTTIPATDGYNVVTTIDANVQQIIEKYLYQFNEENKNTAPEGNGANNLGCIIMDVNTGEILGMASYPNFNLNDTKNINKLIGSKKVNEKGMVPYDAVVLTEENIAEELATDDEVYQNLKAKCHA